MKILIIEDEEAIALVLKEKFKAEGYSVQIASNGESGLEMAKSNNMPDIILLDLILPKKNGFEVLEELKTDPEFRSIPVVVLSNLGEDDNIKKAIYLGAADYFVKSQHPIKEVVEKVKFQLSKGV
jgi:DNA-binding response OmpR family regulator